MFTINYVKNKNKHILSTLDDMSKIQNFIPIYNQFFSLNTSNFNSINLNHKFHIIKFVEKINENKYSCVVKSTDREKQVASFFKFSPLIDPIKFMAGKYKRDKIDILPSLEDNIDILSKIKNPNNAAYIDGFFFFLSSQILHTHGFYHGVDFYGSFLGIKGSFHYNIIDDIDYLYQSDHFHKNKDKKFSIDCAFEDIFLNFNTRNYKKKLKIGNSLKNLSTQALDINDIQFDEVFIEDKIVSDMSQNLIFQYDLSTNHISTVSTKSSSCSSRSSHTSNGSSDSYKSNISDGSLDTGSETSSGNCSLSTTSDEVVEAILKSFPVQIICLEALDNTLDAILQELDMEEWRACIFQIIISLNVYQKMFDLTHNDLHTNNIMFKKTDKKYLYYRYLQKYYKVPTYGRIYKIIDFGRAIYKFKGKRICSDSFHKKGDAATQYNCEPYLNKDKPRLDPNPSFDLCRLGCSLYDFFEIGAENKDELSDPITKLVEKWCKDDRGRNILYKANGEERYPEFKLYKMITRTVHHCPPQKEIENPIFNKFIVSRKKIKKAKIFNIDTLPSYIN